MTGDTMRISFNFHNTPKDDAQIQCEHNKVATPNRNTNRRHTLADSIFFYNNTPLVYDLYQRISRILIYNRQMRKSNHTTIAMMTEKKEQEQEQEQLNATNTALMRSTVIASNITVGGGDGIGSDDGDDGDDGEQANTKELRQPFPVKVYEMLEDADRPEKNFSHIVSWNPIGNGFKVHNKDCFTKEIVPHYFNLTKYKSFQRQLSLYGFQRITVGPDKGLRSHDKLRRSQLELVKLMRPVGYKPRNTGKTGRITTSTTNVCTTTQSTTTAVVKTTMTSASTSTSTSIDLVPDPTTTATNDDNDNTNNDDATTSATTMTMMATTPIVKLTEYPPKSSVALSVISSQLAIDAPDVTMSAMSDSRSIPPVVSSSSLINQHQDAIIIEEKHQRQLENHVHTISPETTFSIHTASNGNRECSDNNVIAICGGEGKDNSSNSNNNNNNTNKQDDEYYKRDQGIQEQQQQQQIGNFEGMCFHILSPVKELGINVKLKLLEEFHPSSSLLKLASKFATTNSTDNDVSTGTKSHRMISSTTSSVQKEQEVVPMQTTSNSDEDSMMTDVTTTSSSSSSSDVTMIAPETGTKTITPTTTTTCATTSLSLLSPSPSQEKSNNVLLEETHCLDALDFHAINVTTRV